MIRRAPELEKAVQLVNRFLDRLDELIEEHFGQVKDETVLTFVLHAPELKERIIERIRMVLTMR